MLLCLVFKLALAAERRGLRLQRAALLEDVVQDIRFVDGIISDKPTT
jgi:hypothetical protein